MRRRLEAYIPIVMLALLVQLLAPIGAFRVVAEAASDPLYMAVICSGMSDHADTTSSQLPPAQHDCCAFCASVLGGAAQIDPPPQVFVALQREYQKVIWLEALDPTTLVRIGSNAQARAPPAIS